jgi:hypothetical protein
MDRVAAAQAVAARQRDRTALGPRAVRVAPRKMDQTAVRVVWLAAPRQRQARMAQVAGAAQPIPVTPQPAQGHPVVTV